MVRISALFALILLLNLNTAVAQDSDVTKEGLTNQERLEVAAIFNNFAQHAPAESLAHILEGIQLEQENNPLYDRGHDMTNPLYKQPRNSDNSQNPIYTSNGDQNNPLWK